ncbi:MAG: lasso peptide biosynthesis B2 protein [Pseudomonadales bacterium]|nr:lasso peptide biosynthesis B2 protein [Pseudomonadales bacterium]
MKLFGFSLASIYMHAFADVLLARRALMRRGLQDQLNDWAYSVADSSHAAAARAAEGNLDARAHAQGLAVRRAARLIPGHHSCLMQALALSRTLRRERIMHELIISTRREQCTLAAHAWIRCRGEVLIGEGPMTEAPALVVMTPKF